MANQGAAPADHAVSRSRCFQCRLAHVQQTLYRPRKQPSIRIQNRNSALLPTGAPSFIASPGPPLPGPRALSFPKRRVCPVDRVCPVGRVSCVAIGAGAGTSRGRPARVGKPYRDHLLADHNLDRVSLGSPAPVPQARSQLTQHTAVVFSAIFPPFPAHSSITPTPLLSGAPSRSPRRSPSRPTSTTTACVRALRTVLLSGRRLPYSPSAVSRAACLTGPRPLLRAGDAGRPRLCGCRIS